MPTSNNEDWLSTKKLYYRKPSQVSYSGVFGCLAYYLDRDTGRILNAICKHSKFIGYHKESKAFLSIDLETRRMVQARSVTTMVTLYDFIVDSEPLQTLELSIKRCIAIAQQSTTTTSETPSAPIEGFTIGPVVLLKRIRPRRYH